MLSITLSRTHCSRTTSSRTPCSRKPCFWSTCSITHCSRITYSRTHCSRTVQPCPDLWQGGVWQGARPTQWPPGLHWPLTSWYWGTIVWPMETVHVYTNSTNSTYLAWVASTLLLKAVTGEMKHISNLHNIYKRSDTGPSWSQTLHARNILHLPLRAFSFFTVNWQVFSSVSLSFLDNILDGLSSFLPGTSPYIVNIGLKSIPMPFTC